MSRFSYPREYRLVEQHVSLQMKRKIYVFKVAREERFEVAREKNDSK